jgi:putative ABC transport system permease protein
MHGFAQDLRYAVRMLLKKPGFTLLVVVTLALGIGANTAIFSVVDAVLLRPLPYDQPDRLVYLSERHPSFPSMSVSYPDFEDWRAENHVFEKIGVINSRDYNLTGRGEPERLVAAQASADLLSALRVRPALGRLYTNQDDRPGAQAVVLLSYELWQRRFAGDPGILGQSLTLNDHPYTVVGVLPRGLSFSRRSDLWVPVGRLADQPSIKSRGNHPGLHAVARLKAGVTLARAQAEMDAIAARLEKQYADSNEHVGVRLEPLLEHYVLDVRRALWVLLGAVGLVLLIACANIANLMLARAASRQREIAVRVSLGAGRWRVMRQLLTESVLLAVIGGGLGLLLAQWGVGIITKFSADSIPRAAEIGIDHRVLAFTALVSLLAGIVFGLAPALQAGRADVQEALKESARSLAGGRHRLRQALVVGEVALTLVLLVGAGLLIHSFYRLQRVDPGFDADHLLSFQVLLPPEKYPDEHGWLDFAREVKQRLQALPGVQEVAVTSRVPMDGNDWQTSFSVVGRPAPSGQNPSMEVSLAGPDYFRVLGIRLLRGRCFDERDDRSHVGQAEVRGFTQQQRLMAGLRSVIVDEDFARRFWPNEDPLGKKIEWASGPGASPLTVVGVVSHVKLYSPADSAGFVQAYFPFLELPENGVSFVVKTALDPELLIAEARKQVQAVDSEQPIYDVASVSQRLGDAIAPQRFNLLLLGLFAALALVLAVVGIYGVMSYSVTQRTHEIGLRIALGAQSREVLKLVVGQALKLALLGGALGLLSAAFLTRLMANLLFGITPTDPITFALVVVTLAGVSFAAAWLPARRATRVDPMVALRYE